MKYDIDGAVVVGATVVTDDMVEVYLRLTTGETIALYGDVEGMNTAPLPTLYKRLEDLEEPRTPLLDMSEGELIALAGKINGAITSVLIGEGLNEEEQRVVWEAWRNR